MEIPLNKYQVKRHPFSGKADSMRGTSGPVTIRAMLDPEAAIPVARPRKPGPNQADINPITGTFTAPLPRPVTERQSTADQKEFENPVKNMPAPTSAIPAETVKRGPYLEAMAPPTSDNRR
jgi:hypothetical protein